MKMRSEDYLDYQQLLIERRRAALWRQLERGKRPLMVLEPCVMPPRPPGRLRRILAGLLALGACILAGFGIGALVAYWVGW